MIFSLATVITPRTRKLRRPFGHVDDEIQIGTARDEGWGTSKSRGGVNLAKAAPEGSPSLLFMDLSGNFPLSFQQALTPLTLLTPSAYGDHAKPLPRFFLR